MIITIDGPAGVGKSSIASYLAQRLNIMLLKSGFFYRALCLAIKDKLLNLPIQKLEYVFEAQTTEWQFLWQTIQGLKIHQESNDIFLNNNNITALLQTPEMDILTVELAKLPTIRNFINDLLRVQGENRDLIAEGRDMGTVVFPQAEYQFFLNASIKVRAERRYKQLQQQEYNFEELQMQMQHRDEIDQNRKESPLRASKNALVIDTSPLTLETVCQIILNTIGSDISCKAVL